jgi:DNA invertase Pin-like site-specific DNA recombinase
MRKLEHLSSEAVSSLLDYVESPWRSPSRCAESPCHRLAAQYVRASSDKQVYSAENQRVAIQEYALEHRLEVVKTYEDNAKSGVVMKRRQGLRQLVHDVLCGEALYDEVLVYDVSRWGRFKDQDEAAFYEFLCRASGVGVQYCAELFPDCASTAGSLSKSLKRAMASEYSRQLSARIFAAKSRKVLLGCWTGGPPPFGMRRALQTGTRKHSRILEPGEWKGSTSDAEILVPGPGCEVEMVKKIFRMASGEQIGCRAIAKELNRRGFTNRGNDWNHKTLHNILTSPVYVGTNVWHRSSQKLQGPTIRTSPEDWVERRGAFDAIVDQYTFDRVQRNLKELRESRLWTEEEILKKLRSLLARKGRLTESLISHAPRMPSCRAIGARFGSLLRAYEAIGYEPSEVDLARTLALRHTLGLRSELTNQILATCPKGSAKLVDMKRRPLICVDDVVNLSLFICRSLRSALGHIRWQLIPRKESLREDLSLIALLNAANDNFQSLYLLPRSCLREFHLLRENDPFLAKAIRLADICELHQAVRVLSFRKPDAE